jgi:hypothetical protein
MRYCKIILPIFLFAAGCTKVINVDLVNAQPQIVIEANVANITNGNAQVKISKTVTVSSNNTFPVVSGATVVITDNNVPIILAEIAPGVYEAPLVAITGHNYTLKVVAEGKTYEAAATMPVRVNLDSLIVENLAFGNQINKTIRPQYTDPVGFGNYYHFREKVNGIRTKTIFVFDDRLNDGGVSTRPLLDRAPEGEEKKTGDVIEVEMQCIDASMYRYYNEIRKLQQNNSLTPTNPPNNLSNGALGYFSVHTTQRRTVTIP